MGSIRRLRDGQVIPLAARSLVGRAGGSRIVLDERFASSEHARIQWTGAAWELRDLGSKNGTFLDGERIEPGRGAVLASGARLGFGESTAGWELGDVQPPVVMAVELESLLPVLGTNEILALPSEASPELSVFPASTGGGWVLETRDGTQRAARDQDVVRAGDRSFRLELPGLAEATPMAETAPTLDASTLRLVVSRDEEHVEISLIRAGREQRVERKWSSYLLLTLARARRDDATLAPEERGWRGVDELTRMLRLDANAINVAIHQARRQISALGIEGAAGVIEVRRGQRRLGTDRFEIVEPPSTRGGGG